MEILQKLYLLLATIQVLNAGNLKHLKTLNSDNFKYKKMRAISNIYIPNSQLIQDLKPASPAQGFLFIRS